jgi:hypothetical protein
MRVTRLGNVTDHTTGGNMDGQEAILGQIGSEKKGPWTPSRRTRSHEDA